MVQKGIKVQTKFYTPKPKEKKHTNNQTFVNTITIVVLQYSLNKVKTK